MFEGKGSTHQQCGKGEFRNHDSVQHPRKDHGKATQAPLKQAEPRQLKRSQTGSDLLRGSSCPSGNTAVDMKLSIDTISEISQHEASPVTTTSPRTAFEQQLCTHLLSLSEVVETLADRLMELETRLAAVEGQQQEDAEIAAVSDDAGELLLASEEKVRMLRDRLTPGEVVALHADSHAKEASAADDHEISETPEMEMDDDRVEDETFSDEAPSDDTEYVDDPQIDLLSA